MTKTPSQIKLVEIEEFFSKVNGVVYWNYRFNGGKWMKEVTAFRDLPWVRFRPSKI